MRAPLLLVVPAFACVVTLASDRTLALAADPAVSAEARISRVTVYSDRAFVERAGKANVPQGAARIVVGGLPDGVDASTVRARSGDVRILAVDTERVPLATTLLPRVEEARNAWKAASRARLAADLEATDAKDALERLRSIRAATGEQAGRVPAGADRADPKELDRVLDFVDERLQKARRTWLAAQAALETAAQTEELLARRLAEVEGSAQRVETRVVLTVTASQAADASFTVQYMVGNASWTPVYDLRVAEDFSTAQIEMNGLVTQRSGEDWSGVPIELTTARPSEGAAPPEPSPWVVGVSDPSPKLRRRADLEDAVVAAPAAPARGMLALEEEKFDADVRRTGLVVAFRSLRDAQVASDGKPSRVALGRWDLAPDVRWTAFPRVTDKVFATAKMKNTTGVPLPTGEARVFVGTDFTGPLSLADWQSDEEVEVGLGVDRQVEVARETLKEERGSEGVFSKDTVHDRAYRITLKNHRSRAIDVRLLDQVPVSRDEALKVVVRETSLPTAQLPEDEAETNRARGVLEWRFRAEPGAEQVLRFAWRATHPAGLQPYGL